VIVDIIEFKRALEEEFVGIIPNIGEYFEKIESLNSSFNLVISETESHWRNYIHAALISLYLKLTAYDLNRWNEYIGIKDSISNIFNFRNSREDRILELFVLHTINKVFDFEDNDFEIIALYPNNSSNPSYLTDDSNESDYLTLAENQKLLNNLKISMKIRGMSKKEIWGDNDIIVVLRFNNTIQQFCIISCKTSLRERVYQSVFWSMHSRLEGIGKHVFITLDKGNSGMSEIGNRDNENNARKTRDVLESTMDRVYVMRNEISVNRSQVIKDFNWLNKDLILWANEFTGSFNFND